MPFSTSLRQIRTNLIVLIVTLIIIFVIGEIFCRLFLPDTRLRYTFDDKAIFYLTPNQTGNVFLATGKASPPIKINKFGFRGPDIGKQHEKVVLVL